MNSFYSKNWEQNLIVWIFNMEKYRIRISCAQMEQN